MGEDWRSEEPKGRVEIIPPGAGRREDEPDAHILFGGSHRIKIVRLGPFGGFIVALALGLLLLLVFFFLTSALLILVPLGLLLAAGAYVSGLFGGGPFRRIKR
jgi:hypothetical protein